MSNTALDDLIERKRHTHDDSGFAPVFMPSMLFDFQKALIEWSVRKGRAAIFADCGLGKSAMEMTFAQNVVEKTNGRVLVLTPLAVAPQMVAEAAKFVARVFDSGTAEAWKSQIAATAGLHRPAESISGPVRLRIRFFMPRAKGHFVSGKPERGLKAGAPTHHIGKPDADNLAKAVMDALTQCGWHWRDDAQVSVLTVVKMYSESCTTGGAMIEIGEVEP